MAISSFQVVLNLTIDTLVHHNLCHKNANKYLCISVMPVLFQNILAFREFQSFGASVININSYNIGLLSCWELANFFLCIFACCAWSGLVWGTTSELTAKPGMYGTKNVFQEFANFFSLAANWLLCEAFFPWLERYGDC